MIFIPMHHTHADGDRQKLLPLRRFAAEESYSPAYLSLLVQRKTLKARKIGRNFYTTREWFDDYLDQHARDGIRENYKRRRASVLSDYKRNRPGVRADVSEVERVAAVVNFKNTLRRLMIAAGLAAAVFVLFAIASAAGLISVFDREGRVAGVETVRQDVSASTTEKMTEGQ